MRITQSLVREIADHAEKFTGGRFRMQAIGGDIGYGTRYIDGVEQLVWLGKHGSREAAAYYIGAMLGWARETGTMIPDDVRRLCQSVQDEYRRTPSAEREEERGRETAGYRAQSRR